MNPGIVTVSYIGATILFILALGGLSNPATARRGNIYGIIGMFIALVATIAGITANIGILVTTSKYGPDAYSFAKDKPLRLLDGSNLLHLLQKRTTATGSTPGSRPIKNHQGLVRAFANAEARCAGQEPNGDVDQRRPDFNGEDRQAGRRPGRVPAGAGFAGSRSRARLLFPRTRESARAQPLNCDDRLVLRSTN